MEWPTYDRKTGGHHRVKIGANGWRRRKGTVPIIHHRGGSLCVEMIEDNRRGYTVASLTMSKRAARLLGAALTKASR